LLVKLQEWMGMISSLFACLAEVKVFANAALVSWTNNWSLATAIAFDVEMLNSFSCR
jgi:low affinity Fe/Cu permease